MKTMSQLLSLKNPIGEVVMATGIGVLLRPKAPLPSEQALFPKAVSRGPVNTAGGGWQAHLPFTNFLIWVLWHFTVIKPRIHSVLIVCLRKVKTRKSVRLYHKCLRLFLRGQRVLGSA